MTQLFGVFCGAALVVCCTAIVAANVAPAQHEGPQLTPAQQKRDDEAFTLVEQARRLQAQQRFREAIGKANQAIDRLGEAFPPADLDTRLLFVARSAMVRGMIADIHTSTGEHDQAVGQLTQQVELLQSLPAPSLAIRVNVLIAQNNLSDALGRAGHAAEAAVVGRNSVAGGRALLSKFPGREAEEFLANLLDTYGVALVKTGELKDARAHLREALAMRRKLYPIDRLLPATSKLALTLSNLGLAEQEAANFAESASCYAEAQTILSSLLAKLVDDPQLLFQLALLRNNRGALERLRGNFAAGRREYEAAIEIYSWLYPAARFPKGHVELARTRFNLARVLLLIGQTSEAVKLFEGATKMFRDMDEHGDYVANWPETGTSYVGLGDARRARGDWAHAADAYADALIILTRAYPDSQYERGHVDLVNAVERVGLTFKAAGKNDEAVNFLSRALDMALRLYPERDHPDGHPVVARLSNSLATAYDKAGKSLDAEAHYRAAIRELQRLHPQEIWPHGHVHLADCHTNLGRMLLRLGRAEQAIAELSKAIALYDYHAWQISLASSEAESLNLRHALPDVQSALISAWQVAGLANYDSLYQRLWNTRARLLSVVMSRQQAWTNDSRAEVRTLYAQYLETRQTLNALRDKVAQYGGSQSHGAISLDDLQRKKETLERQLANYLPEFTFADSAPSQLKERLGDTSVFVEFALYEHVDPLSGTEEPTRVPSFAAFVLASGQPVRFVPLGPAGRIDQRIVQWRKDISAGFRSDEHRANLRRLVWEPVEQCFPKQTAKVRIVSDGSLTALPWSALPGRDPKQFLIEEYNVTVAPSGHLLRKLLGDAHAATKNGRVLTVGDVDYRKTRLPPLPKSRLEMAAIQAIATAQNATTDVAVLDRERATVQRVREILPDVRQAWLAVHATAKIDDPKREASPLASSLLLQSFERTTVYERSPMLRSSVYLADGQLSAEAIAGLPLERLELVVLSACETGVGEVALNEGVYGLTRAFHQAGARNVVATLWSVGDDPTAKLMVLTAQQIWRHHLPPDEALRKAQLLLLRHRSRVTTWDGQTAFELPAGATPEAPAPIHQWAGVFVSGPGD